MTEVLRKRLIHGLCDPTSITFLHPGGGIFLRQAAEAFFVIGDLTLIKNLAIGVECANGMLFVAEVDANGDARDVRAERKRWEL